MERFFLGESLRFFFSPFCSLKNCLPRLSLFQSWDEVNTFYSRWSCSQILKTFTEEYNIFSISILLSVLWFCSYGLMRGYQMAPLGCWCTRSLGVFPALLPFPVTYLGIIWKHLLKQLSLYKTAVIICHWAICHLWLSNWKTDADADFGLLKLSSWQIVCRNTLQCFEITQCISTFLYLCVS